MAEFEIWDPPEERDIESIRARLEATRSDGDLAPAELPDLWVAEDPDGQAHLVYGDGDGAGTIYGHLVMGHDTIAMARFFAAAPGDVEWLLEQLDKLS